MTGFNVDLFKKSAIKQSSQTKKVIADVDLNRPLDVRILNWETVSFLPENTDQ